MGIRAEIRQRDRGEEGFMLLGAVLLVFFVVLVLSVASAKVARNLRRDREVEAVHRANEYVRALQLYYRKNGHYPGNMEQLEKSNNIRFLRQKYPDPMTGKPDWRLIHQGEAKTTVKGFFGQPLSGLPGGAGGLGAASSMVSGSGGTSTVGGAAPTTGATPTTGTAGSGGFSLGPSTSSSNPSSPSTSSGLGGSSSNPSGSTVSSSTGTSGGVSSQSATTFTGGGAPIVGIGSSRTGDSITVVNEKTTYQAWEFLYDPRIEQMKAKAALLGGVPSSGTGSGNSTGSSPFGSSPTSPGSTPFGSSPSSSGSSPFGGGTSTTPTSPPPSH